MRAQVQIVSAILTVALVIGLSVLAGTFITSAISKTAAPLKSRAGAVGAGMVSLLDAQMTTPYTWKVILQNLTEENLDLTSLKAVVYKDGRVCGVSEGFVAESNVLFGEEAQEVIFYGDLDCRLGGESWKIQISSPTGFSAVSKLRPPSSVYLWIPFKSVHDMDWSGKHAVYFHSDDGLATFYGYHDGDAYNFDWSLDLRVGVHETALFFPSDLTKRKRVVVEDSNATEFDGNVFTIAAWLYVPQDINNIVGYRRAITKGRNGDRQWNIMFDYNNKCFHVELYFESGGPCASFAFDLTPGWHHVVFFHEDSGREGLFIDGAAYKTCSGAGILKKNRGPLAIGGWGPSGSDQWYGGIDNVRYYNRILTDEEIQALYRGEDVREGLVLYYTFDKNTIDTDANKVYDVHMWGPGKVGGGVWCDSNGDFADIAVTKELNISGNKQATLVAWVSLPRKSATAYSVNVGYTGTSGRASMTLLYWNAGNQLQFWVETENKYSAVSYAISPWGNKYALLVGVYDEPCLRLYFDGNLVSERCDFAGGLAPLANFSVGKWANNYHIGGIDEVRIYGRALSEEDIKCIYENPECLIDDENLVAYYTFDYPDKAWQSVPDWHHSSKAPRLRKSNSWMYMDANGDSVLFVNNYTLYRKKDFTDVVVLQPNDLNTVSAWTKAYNYGRYWVDTNVGYIFVVRDDASVSNYFETTVKSQTSSGAVQCYYQPSNLNFSVRVIRWLADERNVQIFDNGVLKKNCHFPTDVNTPFDWIPAQDDWRRPWFEHLTIGGLFDLGEKSFTRHFLVLAADRKLDDTEINAICKLFGTC